MYRRSYSFYRNVYSELKLTTDYNVNWKRGIGHVIKPVTFYFGENKVLYNVLYYVTKNYTALPWISSRLVVPRYSKVSEEISLLTG